MFAYQLVSSKPNFQIRISPKVLYDGCNFLIHFCYLRNMENICEVKETSKDEI